MVSKEVLEYAKEMGCNPLDSLSELFKMNEFYEQLANEENCRFAGNHLKLVNLLQVKNDSDVNIKFADAGNLYYTFEEDGKKVIAIKKSRLLPYEAYLICNIATR